MDKTYTAKLQGLFPGHPARRIRYVASSSSGRKLVVTQHYPARNREYGEHISTESFDGVGGLGLMPGYPGEYTGEGKGRWYCEWAALDFDDIGVDEIAPLTENLRRRGVYPYIDRGSSGGGVHVSIFFEEPLDQPLVHSALKAISEIATDLGLPYPCKSVPSNPYDVGTGMFIPYRGAEKDGYGFNPLIDPSTGEQLGLREVNERTERTSREAFLGLSQWRILPENDHNSGFRQKGEFPKRVKAPDSWRAEIDRIKSHWKAGVRQNLAMGVTAYGLMLGLNQQQIEEDVLSIVRKMKDEEESKRHSAISTTIGKYERGENIAFRSYYQAAGVDPPRLNLGVTEEVQEKLKLAQRGARRAIYWKGKGGISTKEVFEAIIRVAHQHGALHHRGVEISISDRQLALEAGLGRKATEDARNRLYSQGLVARGNPSSGPYSGTLIILVDEESVEMDKSTDEHGQRSPLIEDEEWYLSNLMLRLRWGAGRMGKLSAQVLEALRYLGNARRKDIAYFIDPHRKGVAPHGSVDED